MPEQEQAATPRTPPWNQTNHSHTAAHHLNTHGTGQNHITNSTALLLLHQGTGTASSGQQPIGVNADLLEDDPVGPALQRPAVVDERLPSEAVLEHLAGEAVEEGAADVRLHAGHHPHHARRAGRRRQAADVGEHAGDGDAQQRLQPPQVRAEREVTAGRGQGPHVVLQTEGGERGTAEVAFAVHEHGYHGHFPWHLLGRLQARERRVKEHKVRLRVEALAADRVLGALRSEPIAPVEVQHGEVVDALQRRVVDDQLDRVRRRGTPRAAVHGDVELDPSAVVADLDLPVVGAGIGEHLQRRHQHHLVGAEVDGRLQRRRAVRERTAPAGGAAVAPHLCRSLLGVHRHCQQQQQQRQQQRRHL